MLLIIDVEWPESFKEFFSFFEAFSFSFDIFDVIGEEVSIAMGLLVPVLLIYEFDAGLFRERREFKVWRSVDFLDSFLFWDENEMFFSLFFYTVTYLSGVSACTKLLVAEAAAEKEVD
ncbi:hypothetical protein TrLO_g13936 [Triparma laevis f. longispina]|uniref:Uncharacterized protein n=1 Tax=Triparma laevis f. longispina TaxID=1714387 RepID=A0A9W7CEL7_9STRA|nr:hypothetical protein TrLO_g13936 [Triparma laevis f. longispina]